MTTSEHNFEIPQARRFFVEILEEAPRACSSNTYDLKVMAFAELTEADARTQAAQHIARLNKNGRGHRAVFYAPCATCRLTGVKPGCKRKACAVCAGAGKVETGYTFE